MGKLAGKVAVVTGASKGIGAGIARSLAAEGASVVVNYATSKSGADSVVASVKAAGGQAVAVAGDVSRAEDAKGIIDAAIETFGRLDILVNNSGIYEFAPLSDVTEESFHRQFNVNVLGLLLTTQAAAKHLGEGGSVINIGSGGSRIPPPNSAVYTGTKAAIDGIGPDAREQVRFADDGARIANESEQDVECAPAELYRHAVSVEQSLRRKQSERAEGNHGQTRAQTTPPSPCRTGATRAPIASMARMSFAWGSEDAFIWNVMREMPPSASLCRAIFSTTSSALPIRSAPSGPSWASNAARVGGRHPRSSATGLTARA